MLGDLITRILVMVFGYVYPAFQCYIAVEKNRVGIEELRFWCQYWIIVALLSVLERIGDVFVSWLPMYGELKLALFIYLWYPQTKGSEFVYDAILRPYVSKHEIDIDQKLLDWRAKAWDLALFYWKNCTELGQSAFFQVVHYLANQSGNKNGTENDQKQRKTNRAKSETTKSKIVQLQPHNETEYVHIEEAYLKEDGVANPGGNFFNQVRQRLRRFTPLI